MEKLDTLQRCLKMIEEEKNKRNEELKRLTDQFEKINAMIEKSNDAMIAEVPDYVISLWNGGNSPK